MTMDGSWFDAWTRRQFGLVVGSSVGSLLGLSQIDAADAKKKGDRCGHPFSGDACDGGGCCLDLQCIEGSCQLP
jgi:hypothetical protein